MKLDIPSYVKKIIDTLFCHGYEAYVVGGAVRDAVLGDVPDDWDVATSAPAEKVGKYFEKHFDTGIRHGTVTVISEGRAVEVTTYRIDGSYSDNRRPDNVTFTSDIAQDLKRRDFTVNALAYNEKNGILDLFGGLSDIKNKVIKCVGDPDIRFNEDALRIMRAVRFAARLGFEIEEKTFASIKKNAFLLKNISSERIYSELKKTLLCPRGKEILYTTGIVSVLFPFAGDNSAVLKNVSCDVEGGLAAIFIGMNKSQTADALAFLKADSKTKRAVMNLSELFKSDFSCDDASVRKKLSVYGKETFAEFLALSKAANRDINTLDGVFKRVKNDPVSLSELEADGKDMANIGIEGKKIGEMLNYLLSEVIKNPKLNKKEILLCMAQQKSCNVL